MGHLYEKTMARLEILKQNFAQVLFIWEDEFDAQLNANSDMAKFVSSINLKPPLQARAALMGGRVETVRGYLKPQIDQTISYIDITSMCNCKLRTFTLMYFVF